MATLSSFSDHRHALKAFCSVLFITALLLGKEPLKAQSFTRLTDSILIHPEFKKHFLSCSVSGSIAIYDLQTQHWILSDSTEVKQETLPASTFKIINLLIALETRAIKSEDEIVKWPGKIDTAKYGNRPDTYHDMSVKEAFKLSAGWVFVELAKRIGRENYKNYLSICRYGNLDLSEKDTDFWNFGSFAISPINQLSFLRDLYQEKLPFSTKNIRIVKDVMLAEQTKSYSISAKTGWTRDGGVNVGWWVGFFESPSGTFLFATRLMQDKKHTPANFASCRKEITKAILKDLRFE